MVRERKRGPPANFSLVMLNMIRKIIRYASRPDRGVRVGSTIFWRTIWVLAKKKYFFVFASHFRKELYAVQKISRKYNF